MLLLTSSSNFLSADPFPLEELSVESVCVDPTCYEGHVQVMWKVCTIL
jgi:hypothetical protein